MQQRKDLSTWRDPIKGIAILWVCFFHARLGLEHIPVVGTLHQIGYLGADMLLFLSGFGLYHALQKPQTLQAYFTRRMKRLLPAYWPICVLWCILMLPAFQLSTVQNIRSVVGNMTLLGYVAQVPRVINWYPSLILLTIVLAPIVHSFLTNAKRPLLLWAVLVVCACGVGLCYVGSNQMMLFSRLPIFVMGMGFAMPSAQRERPKTKLALYVLGFVLGFGMLLVCLNRYKELLIDYGMYWYPGLLMIPPLCVGLGALFSKLSNVKVLLVPLKVLGQASFEIFLFNVWFEVYCKEIACYTQPSMYLLWLALSIVLGLGWHWLVTVLMRKSKLA